ncbi:MAG TPA: S-methyl-5'-thioadenosine phosphorylase [Clostridiales bacterium]|nr:S-methyl-5'-thioadenosine phosphorylase [Clostridiales bacterium]
MAEHTEGKLRADIGVFGGSGFYELLGEDAVEVWVDTPYGPPSDVITVGEFEGKRVAFLPRHGRGHQYPPHRIPYRANLWAMRELGVKTVFAPCAAGSLQPHVKPADFVVCDQFVDRTRSRPATFYDGPVTVHVSLADPYCPRLRRLLVAEARRLGITVHDGGTVVVIEGPRFSTRAESKWFSQAGWEFISMTQYPEVVLARELNMCYANVALITDYDVGLADDPSVPPVTHEAVLEVFKANNERVVSLLAAAIRKVDDDPDCGCRKAVSIPGAKWAGGLRSLEG